MNAASLNDGLPSVGALNDVVPSVGARNDVSLLKVGPLRFRSRWWRGKDGGQRCKDRAVASQWSSQSIHLIMEPPLDSQSLPPLEREPLLDPPLEWEFLVDPLCFR